MNLPKIKSPLRYPGGKSRALKNILPLIPRNFYEYREPMIGGGSVFLSLKQLEKNKKFWINDLNQNLFALWKNLKDNHPTLVNNIKEFFESERNGKDLYNHLTAGKHNFSEMEKAVSFFILNRITFSGTTDTGGYSKEAFDKRFTLSSIERLETVAPLLKDVKITNEDYEKVIREKGENVFIFLDPPYYTATKSKLYGKQGSLHTGFDHERFASIMKEISHKWLITYDDCDKIKNLFSFANIKTWELQYGMNNYKKDTAAKGKEIFISNYDFPTI